MPDASQDNPLVIGKCHDCPTEAIVEMFVGPGNKLYVCAAHWADRMLAAGYSIDAMLIIMVGEKFHTPLNAAIVSERVLLKKSGGSGVESPGAMPGETHEHA